MPVLEGEILGMGTPDDRLEHYFSRLAGWLYVHPAIREDRHRVPGSVLHRGVVVVEEYRGWYILAVPARMAYPGADPWMREGREMWLPALIAREGMARGDAEGAWQTLDQWGIQGHRAYYFPGADALPYCIRVGILKPRRAAQALREGRRTLSWYGLQTCRTQVDILTEGRG